jgi:hypothetical protein
LCVRCSAATAPPAPIRGAVGSCAPAFLAASGAVAGADDAVEGAHRVPVVEKGARDATDARGAHSVRPGVRPSQ